MSPTRGADEVTEHIWRRSPAAAWSVRAALMLAPLLIAWLVVHLASGWFYRPAGWMGALAWLVQAVAVAVTTARIIEIGAQRLMPLSILLNMSMVFPDSAPSRFGMALKAGSSKRLRNRLDEIGTIGIGASPAEAAERALELVAALAAHDRLTRGHTERVRAYADLIAEEMGLSEAERLRLAWGVLLHDVGKLTVPPEILNKEGKLTDEEWQTLRGHPEAGHRLVEPLAGWLGTWLRATDQHHERWDGKGYPHGLAGTEISLAGRITAVADAYDVITSKRSYKEPMSAEAARQELVRCAGGQFDPEVVRAFLRASVGQRWSSSGRLAWLFEMPSISQIGTSLGSAAATASVAGATTVAAVTATPVLENVNPRIIFGVNAASAAEVPMGAADVPDVTRPPAPGDESPPGLDDNSMGAAVVVEPEGATVETTEVATTLLLMGASSAVSGAAASSGGPDVSPSTTTTAVVLTGSGNPETTTSPFPTTVVSSTSTPPGASPATVPTTGLATTTVPTSETVPATTTVPNGVTVPETTAVPTRDTVPATTTVPTRVTVPETTAPTTTVPTTTVPTRVTVPTTTMPTSETVPTTTVPAAVTVPTPTTTSVPEAGQPPAMFLANWATGDTDSSPVPLPLDTAEPTTSGSLSNYDTDRDNDSGLRLKRSKDGLETDKDTEFQEWEFSQPLSLPAGTRAKLTIYVAEKKFADGKNIAIRAGLYACSSGCRKLSENSWSGVSGAGFREVPLGFDGIESELLTNERLTLRIVAPKDQSDKDVAIAFGTSTYRARLMFE